MNCFQKIVSLIFWTTIKPYKKVGVLLWIAFKKLYLWYSEQPKDIAPTPDYSCELLSKNCIFDILNNNLRCGWTTNTVVNCFQKIVSLIFWTTHSSSFTRSNPLWIAFKKLYLWYSEQPTQKKIISHERCELLSKNCIFDILNNFAVQFTKVLNVVNCFQKIVSLIFWTTWWCNYSTQQRLWIAFKKLYLWYSEQRRLEYVPQRIRCELLSKNCIFDILNNFSMLFVIASIVVNCFQKIVSLIFWTTGT